MEDQMKQIVAALKPLFNEFRADMLAEFAAIDGRLTKTEASLDDIKGVLGRGAVHHANLAGDCADLKRDMSTKQDIANQERRLMDFMTEVQNSRKLRRRA
jgi:hypothetical protein